jgi:ABC-type Fe3+/spermidine/putrescine transport system ATPase subunit
METIWGMNDTAFIEIKDLSKGLGRSQVSEGVSFNLEKGEVFAILGPSGSGKTTLLRCIGGIEKPDRGAIVMNGSNSLIQRKV